MTRINCVDVSTLTDKHLLAEYRELPRVFGLARKRLNSNHPMNDIPKDYILGSGHVKFFYTRLAYLYNRQIELILELKYRGFKLSHSDPADLATGLFETNLWNDWQPTPEAIAINQARINDRLSQRRD